MFKTLFKEWENVLGGNGYDPNFSARAIAQGGIKVSATDSPVHRKKSSNRFSSSRRWVLSNICIALLQVLLQQPTYRLYHSVICYAAVSVSRKPTQLLFFTNSSGAPAFSSLTLWFLLHLGVPFVMHAALSLVGGLRDQEQERGRWESSLWSLAHNPPFSRRVIPYTVAYFSQIFFQSYNLTSSRYWMMTLPPRISTRQLNRHLQLHFRVHCSPSPLPGSGWKFGGAC